MYLINETMFKLINELYIQVKTDGNDSNEMVCNDTPPFSFTQSTSQFVSYP